MHRRPSVHSSGHAAAGYFPGAFGCFTGGYRAATAPAIVPDSLWVFGSAGTPLEQVPGAFAALGRAVRGNTFPWPGAERGRPGVRARGWRGGGGVSFADGTFALCFQR